MANARTFPGGVHPKEYVGGKAATNHIPIRQAKEPVRVVIPLSQHIGKPCRCVVEAGQTVDMGQVIGEADGPMSVNTHASVSGRVVSVSEHPTPDGYYTPTVVIDNDFAGRWHADVHDRENVDALTAEAMAQIVREAGVVGLGGALFPTALKLSPPADKQVDTLILNGAECEPYLSCDHRMMLEDTAEIVDGMLLALRMLGAARGIIGIEDNKPDAVEAMRNATEGSQIQVISLPVKYPQGAEKQLIYSLTGRIVPEGGLPHDVGAVCVNVSTAASISRAIRKGIPLIERVLTVGGRVVNPCNLRVRIGTTVADVLDECGGLTEGVRKMVAGGPMMGRSLSRLDFPVTKGHNGFIALGDETLYPPESPCIKCARCVETCPMRLSPTKIDAAARRRRWDVANEMHVLNCMECGCCDFVCPAKRLLTQSCRVAKAGIRAAQLNKQ